MSGVVVLNVGEE